MEARSIAACHISLRLPLQELLPAIQVRPYKAQRTAALQSAPCSAAARWPAVGESGAMPAWPTAAADLAAQSALLLGMLKLDSRVCYPHTMVSLHSSAGQRLADGDRWLKT